MQKVEKLLEADPTALLEAHLERIVTHSAGEEFKVEINITGSHMHSTNVATEESLHSAIDIAEGLAIHEIVKNKGKRIHQVRKQATRFKNFLKGFQE